MDPYTGDPRQAPNGSVVQQWPDGAVLADGTGKFYQIKNGKRSYVPPAVVLQGYHPEETPGNTNPTPTQAERTPVSGAPGGFFHERGQFDPETGGQKQDINWSNIMSLGVGGLIAAPVLAGALAGAGGGAASSAVPASSLTGATTLPVGVAASGAVPAALAGTGTAATVAGTGGAAAAAGGGMTANTYLELAKLGLGAVGSAASANSQHDIDQRRLDLEAQALQNTAENNRATFRRQNPGVQMGNSVRGDVLAGVQPASFTGSGRDLHRTGGLSPALLSDNSRQLGSLISRQALLSAMGQADSQGNIGGIPDPYRVPTDQPPPAQNPMLGFPTSVPFTRRY